LWCDEYVLLNKNNPAGYATDIIDIARSIIHSQKGQTVLSFTKKNDIENRVKALFEVKKKTSKLSVLMIVFMSLGFASQIFSFSNLVEVIEIPNSDSNYPNLNPLKDYNYRLTSKYGEGIHPKTKA
jgi:hypothetical protein